MSARKKFPGISQPATFTVAQASAITGVPQAQVNQYIDRDLNKLDLIISGSGERRVNAEALVALRLVHDFTDGFAPAFRLELVRKALLSPNKKSIQLGDGKVTARVDVIRRNVAAGLKDYKAAVAQVHASDDILGGEPCLKGTRTSVYTLAGLMAECGATEVKRAYSWVSDAQLAACAVFAKANPLRGRRPKSIGARLEASQIKPRRSRTKIIA